MGGLLPFSFLSPWLLAALISVPAIWWLLRVLPPQPRIIRLPSFFLLKDIKTEIKSAAYTPWWLLLIRALIAVCFIVAFAAPVLKSSGEFAAAKGDVLMIVDNGWASVASWDQRVEKMKEYVFEAGKAKRNVTFILTAPSRLDEKIHDFGPFPAEEADKWLDQLKPDPWSTDHHAAVEAAAAVFGKSHIGNAVFFSDGITQSQGETAGFLQKLADTVPLTVVEDEKVNNPFILRKTSQKPDQVTFHIERAAASPQDVPMTLVASSAGGNVLDQLKFVFPASTLAVDVPWNILNEMRNKIARIELQNPVMASAVYLTDAQWQQHAVGIVSDPARKASEGFLNEVYYLRRALQTSGTVEMNEPDALMKHSLSAIIWPDSAAMTSADRVALLQWVQDGGFLIRFAGPYLAANTQDPLLPVPLRDGERAMEGAMTWEKPLHLGAIADTSPLFGLDVPKDVLVTRQVLATPEPEVFEKTWMQLDDGTPLITGGQVGKGTVVLVHTTAGPDWSTFCYSGLYVETLQRLISLSAGVDNFKAQTVLPPLQLIDAFGRLAPPENRSLAGAFDPRDTFVPSPKTPPGIYGSQQQFEVFNLGDYLPAMQRLAEIPEKAEKATYELSGAKSLKSFFLQCALLLLLLDTILTLVLRGVLPSSFRKPVALAVTLFFLLHAVPVQAQETPPADLVSGIYMAYIETGDQQTDQLSHNGLDGLKDVVNTRTNIKVRGVRGVNPETDDLFYYPFLYWPLSDSQPTLSLTAAHNIQQYLAEGGMILIDTRDRQDGDNALNKPATTARLQKLTQNIQIGELMPVEQGHILTKSFYLLDSFPGANAGGRIWAEKEPSPNYDSVTSVIIGGNNWAAAWSADAGDRGSYQISPGGEQQREMAYRFGVNVLMVALAGNYKADQVHVPYILERFKQ